MSTRFKLGITGLIAAIFVTFGAFGLGGGDVSADIPDDGVWQVDAHGISPPNGSTIPSEDCSDSDENPTFIAEGDTVILRTSTTSSTDDELIFCVNSTDGEGDVSFDADDVGRFDQAACGLDGDNDDGDDTAAEWDDDECVSTIGSGTDSLIVPDAESSADNDVDVIIVRYTCGSTNARTTITIEQSDVDGDATDDEIVTFTVHCRGLPSAATLTAIPTVVEIVPAAGSVAHSFIDLVATDSSGGAVFPDDSEVVFTTDRCSIESDEVDTPSELNSQRDIYVAYNNSKTAGNAAAVEASASANGTVPAANSDLDPPLNASDSTPQSETVVLMDVTITGASAASSRAATILHCEPDHAAGVGPGIATITAVISIDDAPDITRTVTVTVVGPPAFITVSASPTSLRCGEKSEITARITDAIGQNVSDHTLVEMVTNLGGVLGGTGAVVGFAGPVVPISSTVSETFAGIAKAFLLTSESHSGPYEVVVASGGGGSVAGDFLGGIFSTPPVVAQVTVTCSLPTPVVAAAATPTITAPRTGTGITPPNTGDAGLLDSNSSSSWALYALAGTALAFALAGLAATKASRR